MPRAVRQAGRVRVLDRPGRRGVALVEARRPWAKDTVLARVRDHQRAELPVDNLKPAAVLVPLVPTDEGFALLLTQRAAGLGIHGGQVSFPGGHVDGGDTDRWDTALREAREELGIPPEAVERVGQIDDFRTVTRFHITPCVGVVSADVPLRPCTREVADVFTVPLAHFFDDARRRTMRICGWGHDRRVFFYLTTPHVVWGATAGMVHGLTELLTGRSQAHSTVATRP